MKTITINIEETSIEVLESGVITRDDFRNALAALVEKYGNKPGIKRTVSEKMAAKATKIAEKKQEKELLDALRAAEEAKKLDKKNI
jgi:hypothetical protein